MPPAQETNASNSPSVHHSTNGKSSLATASSDAHRGTLDMESHPKPITPTSFPSLTGLRSSAIAGTIQSVSIDSKLRAQDLQDTVRRIGASPSAAIQAAWAALLLAYTDSKDGVAFVATLRNEPSSSLGSSTNALRKSFEDFCSCSSDEIYSKDACMVLRRLTDHNLNQSHDEIANVSRESQKFQQTNGTHLILDHLSASPNAEVFLQHQSNNNTDFNQSVSIEVSLTSKGLLRLSATFTDATLDDEAALLTLKHLDSLLQAIISEPCLTISHAFSKIAVSSLSISNPKPERLPSISSFQSQFEEFARTNPELVALDFRRNLLARDSEGNIKWTYQQLNDKAEAFADTLFHNYGWLANNVVPICMDRCPEIYLAILGILKAGGGWCPIDPSFPSRRRHDLIVRTGAQMLVTNSDRLDGVPKGVSLMNIATPKDTSVQKRVIKPTQPDDLAYLIWTSGTTGEPKGVPIHVEAAVTAMKALQKSIPTDVSEGVIRCLQFSQFTFDVFVQDLFYTWGVGGTLVSSDRSTMLGSFADLATTTGATHAHLTPAFAASLPRDCCPTLQVITMIGEKLTQNVADDWGRNMRAFNTYGPAETTVVSTYKRFGGPEDRVQSANVGLPLPSVTIAVMKNGKPMMTNGIGELALGGPQVSKGYWKDPGKTSDRFVWSEALSMTLYMTGDIVRMLHDQTIEFVGRTDDLVKIQGIRVELSEIAFSLRSCHPQVQQVEVQYLDRLDRPSKLIVAFFAPQSSGDSCASLMTNDQAVEIAQAAKREAKLDLPEYMIPHVFLVLGSIPRTPSNKIDRTALKDLYASADLGPWEAKLSSTTSARGDTAAWTREEALVLDRISHLTGTSIEAIARASTLPSTGIDSISATRLVTVLNVNGSDISLAEVLRCQDLGEFLVLARSQSSKVRQNSFDVDAFSRQWLACVEPEIDGAIEYVTPALPLQESLLSESTQNADMYWTNTFFALESDVDLTTLRAAWNELASETDALRAAFVPIARFPKHPSINATFLQVIFKDRAVDWIEQEGCKGSLQQRAAHRAKGIANRHQVENFSIPLWAVTIFHTGIQRVMMFTIHHAIRDEPSFEYIMQDLSQIYSRPNQLDTFHSRHQLRDALSILSLQDDQREQDTAFWTETLSDYSHQEDTKTLPDLSNHKSATGFINHAWDMSKPYHELQTQAFAIGASSVASLLRITWGIILTEYLGADRVVFGETWSVRSEAAALADVVGPLISVVPVPLKRQGTAQEVLRDQAALQRASKSHLGIHPLVIRRILERSETEALYPAVFNFIPDMEVAEGGDDQKSAPWQRIEDMISLSVEHSVALNASMTMDGKLALDLVADRQVLDAAHLAVLARQIEALTYAIFEHPDIPVNDLRSYMPENLLSISIGDGVGAHNPAFDVSPCHWVDHFATIEPAWPAAEVAESIQESNMVSKLWSYGELQRAYRRVHSLIQNYGCGGKMIAVCLERRLDVYAVILGILSSGSTYLPIAEDLPSERKMYLLQDSNAAMLFTSKSQADAFTTLPDGCIIIDVDDLDYSIQGEPVTLFAAKSSDDAYLLYTSGSTGKPKGVLVSRGNLNSFTEADSIFICAHVHNMSQLQGKGKYLGLASYAFDVHLKEMFTAWRHGMATVTAPRSLLLDGLEMALRALKITHASFVPSLIDSVGLQPSTLPDLRYLTVGGEMISKRVIDTWAGHPRVTLVNAYGPTEATIGCCFQKVAPSMSLRNIGPPLSFTKAHVLQPDTLDYTLRGTAGELCLTGDLVANGYHNRPDAKGFVDEFRGERMYRTGDIVRLMADGSLDFLGRGDDQTKVRGQRLELGEVSETVRTAATSTLKARNVDVAAIVAEHISMPKPQLVVFVASRQTINGEKIAVTSFSDDRIVDEIRSICRKTLPAFMVPDHIIPLTRLPVAIVSRKVDAKRLTALFAEIPIESLLSSKSSITLDDRPLNETERKLADIVTSTLDVKDTKLSPTTNLFQVGLDSLSAISLTIKLQKLGLDCSVTSVMKHPLIEQLALLPQKDLSIKKSHAVLEELSDLESRFLEQHASQYEQTPIRAVRPCLPLQETLVASSFAQTSQALYVNHVALQISEDVDLQRLRKAWQDTVTNHDILRTCFGEFENHFVQIVLQDCQFHWTDIIVPASEDLLPALKERESETSLALLERLTDQPPLRFHLAMSQALDKDAMLLVSIHHALYDGESFPMILDEVYSRYQSLGLQPRTTFSQLVTHVWAQSKQEAKNFWTRYLNGYKPTTLQASAGEASTREIARSSTTRLAQIEQLAASMKGTPASLLQAIFGIVLAQHLNKHDVVFGTVYSGRTIPIENPHTILAPCITTIPQRVTLRHQNPSSISDAISTAQAGFVESLEYQHTALRDIHRWVKAEKPQFDCLFSYVQKRKPAPWSQLWWEIESSVPSEFPFALEVEADVDSDSFLFRCVSKIAPDGSEQVELFLENMDLLLATLARGETIRVGDLGVSASGEEDIEEYDETTWGERELVLRDVVVEITGLPPDSVSKGASFFSLGIDSISAIRFAKTRPLD
ncbi:NRPS [Bacidia gigantensis]|uniref:NRPS n=1 Tax=Bacidia gigantensis TaxID=2732470 RepID=UPI001D054B69|nr:NRPS [Bacidia gigantensis]KAG8527809.1 NRPS [Bacidia gigantensis]